MCQVLADTLDLTLPAEHHGRCRGNWPLKVSQSHFHGGLIEPQMLSTESGIRATSNQLLMDLSDGTEGIVPEQWKVGINASLHHALQEPFAFSAVLCLHSVIQDVLLFEQAVAELGLCSMRKSRCEADCLTPRRWRVQ